MSTPNPVGHKNHLSSLTANGLQALWLVLAAGLLLTLLPMASAWATSWQPTSQPDLTAQFNAVPDIEFEELKDGPSRV